MSRRLDSRVPKYAFIKFACDGKTMQIKSKDLVSTGAICDKAEVMAPWEKELMKAVVLGLSDDPTVLNDIERKYMQRLSDKSDKAKGAVKPRQASRKAQPVPPVRKTSLLKNRTNTLKRKPSEGIEFQNSKVFKPMITSATIRPHRTYDMSQLSQGSIDMVTGNASVAEANGSSEEPLLPTASVFPTGTPVSFTELLSSDNSTYDMGLQEVTPRPEPLPFPPPVVPTAQPVSVSDLLASARTASYGLDLRAAVQEPETVPQAPTGQAEGVISQRLDEIMTFMKNIGNFMKRMDEKMDSLSTSTTRPSQREMSTQTDEPTPVVSETRIIPTIIITPPEPSLESGVATDITESDTPTPAPESTADDPQPPFADRRLFDLRPADLEGQQIDRESLTGIVERMEAHPPTTHVDQKQIFDLITTSKGAGNFAKNLVFHKFTLGELYGRNAFGRNFLIPGRSKKRALDPVKLKEILDLVALHYKEENAEKTAIRAINTGLRYLWNVRLRQSWLNIDNM